MAHPLERKQVERNQAESNQADLRFVVLDGGFASELEARGEDLRHGLWSAKVLKTNPRLVADVHRDYFRAGADFATTATYQVPVHDVRLMESAVILAHDVREEESERQRRPLFVAASVGPYGAGLGDGSEYRGDYGVSADILRDFHRQRLEILTPLYEEGMFEVAACETVPSREEAEILAELLEEYELPGWLSFTLKSPHEISDGSRLLDVARDLREFDLVAVGVNCCAAEQAIGAVKYISEHVGGLNLIAYPNAGGVYDAQTKVWSPAGYCDGFDIAKRLYDAGARMIGGCCRTGPEFIRAVARFRDSLI